MNLKRKRLKCCLGITWLFKALVLVQLCQVSPSLDRWAPSDHLRIFFFIFFILAPHKCYITPNMTLNPAAESRGARSFAWRTALEKSCKRKVSMRVRRNAWRMLTGFNLRIKLGTGWLQFRRDYWIIFFLTYIFVTKSCVSPFVSGQSDLNLMPYSMKQHFFFLLYAASNLNK